MKSLWKTLHREFCNDIRELRGF